MIPPSRAGGAFVAAPMQDDGHLVRGCQDASQRVVPGEARQKRVVCRARVKEIAREPR